ncbi:MAG TPA: hypothetical protein VHE35_09690 [Kofleriaceae bacterium]|nr:hypothetical protein [Kofleriaceae bacterium]
MTRWLDGLGPPGPLALDELTACFLRVCRTQAAGLREARSAGLDRTLVGWRQTLAEALRGALRTTVARLADLATRTSLAILWERLHEALPERPDLVRVLVARVCADALDEAVGHQFVACFRQRARWRLAPGDPFPVASPALRDLFGKHLTSHPDARDLPIDRTTRLALAPDAEGVEVVLDLDADLPVPAPDATIAVCLPFAAPLADLRWDDDRKRGRFFGVRPRDPAASLAAVEDVVAQAMAARAQVVIFPELAVDTDGLAAVAGAAAIVEPPPLVVAGSRHTDDGGAPRNIATVLAGDRRFEHGKWNPFVAGELIEGIVSTPAQVIVRGTVDAAGRFVWSLAVLVCKDFLSLGAHQALTAVRPSLILVPAMSERTAVFEADAVGLTAATQATCIVANQVAPARAGDPEDPAVVIVTRPVPWALTEIVRRSEVSPPACVLLHLRPEPP